MTNKSNINIHQPKPSTIDMNLGYKRVMMALKRSPDASK